VSHQLIVDDRERASGIIDLLYVNAFVDFEVKRLTVGDYLVDNWLLVERKSMADLVQSIITGRVFQQASRLAKSDYTTVIILEGRAQDIENYHIEKKIGNGKKGVVYQAYDKALKLDNGNSRAQSKLSLIKDLFGTGSKTIVAANTATPTRPIRPANKKVEPAPAPKPAPEVAPADTSADAEGNVLAAVEAWRAAWASQNIDQYLASYADSFTPAKGRSLANWKEFRRGRVTKPSKINLTINNQKTEVIDDSNAKVSFKQYYKADGRPIRTNKTLILKKVDGSWLINKEIASN
ncbi:MAG: hypothetical protein COB34_08225, partial [Methylophilaceae bacterium]